MRSLSEVGQTSSSGPGPSGHAVARPSGGGQQSYWSWVGQQDANLLKSLLGPNVGVSSTEGTSYFVPVGVIVQGVESLVSFFDWLFGGPDNPPTPRQLLHGRHPLYDGILGIRPSEAPTEGSEAPTESESTAPSTPCNPPPLQLIADNTSNGPGDIDWCTKRCQDLALQRGINRKIAPDQSMWLL